MPLHKTKGARKGSGPKKYGAMAGSKSTSQYGSMKPGKKGKGGKSRSY